MQQDRRQPERREKWRNMIYIYILYLYKQLYSTVYRKLMEIQELCLHVFQHECWCVELKYCISGLVPRQKRIDRNVNFFPMHQIWWAWLGCCCPRAKLTKNCGLRKRTRTKSCESHLKLRPAPGALVWVSKQVQTAFDCVFAALETSASNSPGTVYPGTETQRKRPGPD